MYARKNYATEEINPYRGYRKMQMCHSGLDGFHNLSARTITPDIKTTTVVDRSFPFRKQEF